MGRFSVVRLSSYAFVVVSALASQAAADHSSCRDIDRPTTISTDRKCVRVVERVKGNVVNSATVGEAHRDRAGFFIGGDGRITGALINNGTIIGGGDDWAALTLGKDADVKGGIFNNGTIVSAYGNAINLGYREDGHRPRVRAVALTGDIVNAGLIDGHKNGIAALYGTMSGALINESGGTIRGGDVAVLIANGFTRWTGGIDNAGLIEGASGLWIGSGVFGGGLFNAASASIVGLDGDGVFAKAVWSGDFENRGLVSGSSRGFAYEGPSFGGDVVNDGEIGGGHVAFFMNASLFDGAFVNSGAIAGGATGVALVLGHATGGFTNSGAIAGDTGVGVFIDVDAWGAAAAPADIVNASGGTIFGGETGFWLSALNVFGDFINDGEISGGGVNTGIRIEAQTYVGNIWNNGTASAPSNAVFVRIGELIGAVRNTGTITAGAPDGVAVMLEIGNGTTFTNEDGGLILGDVVLGGSAGYTFLGRDGGLEGDLIGNGGAALSSAANNDLLIVAMGTQYFVDGQLTNLLRFDVEDGGVAVMGGRFVGDPDGPGYGSTNVDALTVHAGGRLYLDDDTILNVGSFTQESGGELTYYLVAPGGAPVAGSDYGRIDATGPVSLAGKLSVVLDAASFGGTTQNTFNYADIIRGSSFSGEFEDFEILGSSYFFELQLTYGGSSINLGVTRTPFDVVLCEQFQSQNAAELGAALEAAFLKAGFTPAQVQLFNFLGQLSDVCGAYFDLGGAVLGDIHAITVETAGPWKGAVNDRLNSTGATSCVVAGSAGCLTRFAQAGGTQVMSDAEDPFAWLRTGVRPEGQFSVWGRLLGVQGDNRGRGASLGSDFTVTGGIAGADYVFSQRFIAGVAAQWTNTDVDFKRRNDTADVQSFEFGGYFSYGDADFCVNGNASIIFHDFDTYRFPFGGTAHGAYEGMTVSAYLEAGKVFEFDVLRVEPIVALSFAGLDTDDYRETGTALTSLLNVEGASHRSLKSVVGVRFAYPLDVLESGRKIVPEARIMWAHEHLDDQAQFRAALQVLPDNPFNVRGQAFARDSLLGGVGLNVPLTAQAALYIDYDVAMSRDQVIQSVSVGARVSW